MVVSLYCGCLVEAMCSCAVSTGAVKHRKKGGCKSLICNPLLAEREGFEPPEVLPSTVFKTAAIDHSAISPKVCAAWLCAADVD